MKKLFFTLMLCSFLALPGHAQQKTFQDTLIDHMCGKWVLRGLIAGKSTVHDITAEWVLNHQFLLIREVSREKNEKGEPEYQANVYLGWSEPTAEYICIWLDVWGGYSPESVGRAKRHLDKLPFDFRDAKGVPSFHTTLAYEYKSDTWFWIMDNDEGGALKPFARVSLTRN
jgi:hypothetical protein